MISLSTRNHNIHQQLVDSVMHAINDGTTGGPWKDRGKEMLAAIGMRESPKRKAERREQRMADLDFREEERKRFEEKQANEVLREKHRRMHERYEEEKNVVERLKEQGYNPGYEGCSFAESCDDDGHGLPPFRKIIDEERNEPPMKPWWDYNGKDCLPPHQRTTPSREIIDKERNEPSMKPWWDYNGKDCLPPHQR